MKRVQFPKGGSNIQKSPSAPANAASSHSAKNIQMTGHYYNPSGCNTSDKSANQPASNSTSLKQFGKNLVNKFLKTDFGYSMASAFGYKLDESEFEFVPPQKPVKPQGTESQKYKSDLEKYQSDYNKYFNLTEYPGRPNDRGSRAYAEWSIKNKSFLNWKAQEIHRKEDEAGTFDKNGYRNIAASDITSEFD